MLNCTVTIIYNNFYLVVTGDIFMDVWVTVVISRFVYRQDDEANSSDVKEEFGVDKDGDFVVTRKRAANKLDVMIIGDLSLLLSTPLYHQYNSHLCYSYYHCCCHHHHYSAKLYLSYWRSIKYDIYSMVNNGMYN